MSATESKVKVWPLKDKESVEIFSTMGSPSSLSLHSGLILTTTCTKQHKLRSRSESGEEDEPETLKLENHNLNAGIGEYGGVVVGEGGGVVGGELAFERVGRGRARRQGALQFGRGMDCGDGGGNIGI